MVLKIDYDTVKFQRHRKYVIKIFLFLSPSLIKILVALLPSEFNKRHKRVLGDAHLNNVACSYLTLNGAI